MLDIDDTVKAVFGAAKQGAQHGYTKVRGLNAQLATVSTEQAAPVIVGRPAAPGAASSAHGAVRLVRDAITTARRAGVTGPILVRTDSAYYNHAFATAVTRAGAWFSIGARHDRAVRRAIAAIDAQAWVASSTPKRSWTPTPGTGVGRGGRRDPLHRVHLAPHPDRRPVDRAPGPGTQPRQARHRRAGGPVQRLALSRDLHHDPRHWSGRVPAPRPRRGRASHRRPEGLRAGAPTLEAVHRQRRLAGRRRDRVQPDPRSGGHRRREVRPRRGRDRAGPDHQHPRPGLPLRATPAAAPTRTLALGDALADPLDTTLEQADLEQANLASRGHGSPKLALSLAAASAYISLRSACKNP